MLKAERMLAREKVRTEHRHMPRQVPFRLAMKSPSTLVSRTEGTLPLGTALKKQTSFIKGAIHTALFLFVGTVVLGWQSPTWFHDQQDLGIATRAGVLKSSGTCVQQEPLFPQSTLRETLGAAYATEEFLAQAVEWLSGAVRIPYVYCRLWCIIN